MIYSFEVSSKNHSTTYPLAKGSTKVLSEAELSEGFNEALFRTRN